MVKSGNTDCELESKFRVKQARYMRGAMEPNDKGHRDWLLQTLKRIKSSLWQGSSDIFGRCDEEILRFYIKFKMRVNCALNREGFQTGRVLGSCFSKGRNLTETCELRLYEFGLPIVD